MVANAVEFEAKIDNNWIISIPEEYRGYLTPSLSRVILLNTNTDFIAKKEDNEADVVRRKAALKRLDGILEGRDFDLNKIREERLSRQ